MWQNLTTLQQVYFCIATFFSVVLVVQFILAILGVGQDSEADLDLDGDGEPDITVDTSDGIISFTLKGIIAFFAIGGWLGFALGDGTVPTPLVIILSVIAGFAALVGVGFLMKWIMRLQSSGTMDIKNAVGKIAEVYLTIPAKCSGNGKINLDLQGSYAETEAITESDEPIKTGEKVKVVRTEGSVCVVERLYNERNEKQ